MNTQLPESIRKITDGKPFTADSTGMSGSQVLIYDGMVLKTEPKSRSAARTAEVMKWLRGRIPVPEVIAYEEDESRSHLLMTRIKGRMASNGYYLERPQLLYRMLARALEMLWNTDISGCPCEQTPDILLEEAERRVKEGRVNMDYAEPDTFGENGFASPYELLDWLKANKPRSFEPVLSHGDLSLPNIFLNGDSISGFIDLSRTGISDKWRDISIALRSTEHNLSGRYGGKVYGTFDEAAFFDAIGIEPDRERIRFYILLDELF